MLTAMLNESPEVLSTSEELFALYLYPRYANKTRYTEKEIDQFIREFYLLSERNLTMYFAPLSVLKTVMMQEKDNLPFQKLCRLIYFHFLDLKDKSEIKMIVDKQIKYLYHLKRLKKIFPDAKIIVLVRDVRDNILSRKKRKLNESTDYLYLSAIWNDTYKNAAELLDGNNNNILLLRYEDLVTDPQSHLKRVCEFLGIAYSDSMLSFHETFNRFLEAKKEEIGEEFYSKVKDFHSGMREPVSTDKIGKWKGEIDQVTAGKIATLCGSTARRFGYDLSLPYPPVPLSFTDHLRVLHAQWKRFYFLRFYMWLPVAVKLLIKRVRGKRIYKP